MQIQLLSCQVVSFLFFFFSCLSAKCARCASCVIPPLLFMGYRTFFITANAVLDDIKDPGLPNKLSFFPAATSIYIVSTLETACDIPPESPLTYCGGTERGREGVRKRWFEETASPLLHHHLNCRTDLPTKVVIKLKNFKLWGRAPCDLQREND